MVSRLDKVIGIPVRVSTPYTRYGPEYTFTKPFAFPTFMYILLLSTTIFKLILTLFPGHTRNTAENRRRSFFAKKMVLNTVLQKRFTAGDNRAPNRPLISKAMTSLNLKNKVSNNKRGHQYPRG